MINMIPKYTLIVFLFVIAITSYSQDNDIFHSTCKLYLNKSIKHNDKTLLQYLKKILLKKRYKVINVDKNTRFKDGDLYLNFTLKMTGNKIFKDCSVKGHLKKTENKYISKKDKLISKGLSNRGFPRLSIAGARRCRLAIRDALFIIPSCNQASSKQ